MQIPREWAATDSDLNCAARVLALEDIPQEASDASAPGACPPDWPARGAVEFHDVQMRYRPELPLVLRGISFSVAPGEKVRRPRARALLTRSDRHRWSDRTSSPAFRLTTQGAGKSSCLHALFRMGELDGGSITIDGVCTATLGLDDLRRRICVLPQSTLVLKGSVRDNLDPFGEHDDAVLHDALRRSYFGHSRSLDSPIETGGSDLSSGEKALLSLARAVVRRSKLLVLDEPTAHVDAENDARVQQTIATDFADATVIAIAHRLRVRWPR